MSFTKNLGNVIYGTYTIDGELHTFSIEKNLEYIATYFWNVILALLYPSSQLVFKRCYLSIRAYQKNKITKAKSKHAKFS